MLDEVIVGVREGLIVIASKDAPMAARSAALKGAHLRFGGS